MDKNNAAADKTLAEINAIIAANNASNDRGSFDGLTSDEIARRNRVLMFGDNDEAFPSQEEWSSIVD